MVHVFPYFDCDLMSIVEELVTLSHSLTVADVP